MASEFKKYAKSSVLNETIIFTVPTGKVATVIGMTVANIADDYGKVDIKAGDQYVIKGAYINKGSALVPIGGDQKVVIHAGESIKVSAEVTMDVICNVLEADQ
jgi:hypothetical protein